MRHIAIAMFPLAFAVPVSAGGNTLKVVICDERESAQEIFSAYVNDGSDEARVVGNMLIEGKFCRYHFLPISTKLKTIKTKTVSEDGLDATTYSIVRFTIPGNKTRFSVAVRSEKGL